MGFFGALKEGLSRAATWAVNNSGTILGVAQTVAKIARIAVLKGGEGIEVTEVDPEKPLDGYYTNFIAASKVITDEANQLVEHKDDADVTISGDGIKTRSQDVCGLWAQPTILNADGEPSSSMYKDVATWIGAYGAPSTYISPDGSSRDLAYDIACSVFVNPTPNPRAVKNPQDLLVNLPFSIVNKQKDFKIEGRHVYYGLPLGKYGADQSWHSALHYNLTTNKQYEERVKAEKTEVDAALQRARVNDNSFYEASVTGWNITLNIRWASASLATNIQKPFLDKWTTDYKTVLRAKITVSSLNGPNQTLKIEAPAQIIPARVRTTISAAAGYAATNYKHSKDTQANGDSEAVNRATEAVSSAPVKTDIPGPPENAPVVLVTDSSITLINTT